MSTWGTPGTGGADGGFAERGPEGRRSLGPSAPMLRPILWTRWLLVRVVTCAVLAVVLTVVLVGGDDLVLGRTLFATLAGALVGLFTVAVLTRWDVLATADDLDG